MDKFTPVTARPDAHRLRKMWVITLMTIIPLAVFALYITRNTTSISGMIGLAVAFPAILVTLGLRRIEWSGTLTIMTLALSGLVAISWINGLGMLIGIAFAILAYQVAVLMLPEPMRSPALGMIGVVAVSIVFVDLFFPSTRITLTGRINLLTWFISSGAALVFSIYLLRSFHRYTLRTKFLISVSILAVTAVIINILFVTYSSRRIAFDSTGQTLKSRAVEKANLLATSLNASLESLALASQDTGLISRIAFRNSDYLDQSPAAIQGILGRSQAAWEAEGGEFSETAVLATTRFAADRLRLLRDSSPAWERILLVDRQGGTIAMTEFIPEYDHSDEVWWQRAIAGEVFIGRPEIDPYSGQAVLIGAVPAVDENNEILGVMQGVFRLSSLAFLEELSGDFYGESAGFLQIAIGDSLLQFADGGVVIEPVGISREALEAIEAETYVLASWQGDRRLLAVASVPDTNLMALDDVDLRILKHIQESDVIDDFTAQQRGQVVIGIGTILTAIAAAVVVANIVTQPILSLTQTAEQLAAGNLKARASIQTGDEISTLAAAFNGLAEQVESSVQNLESRVSERTQALNASFRISRSLVSIIDREELVQTIVREVKEAFDYYHVHIYLYEAERHRLVLAAGSGEIGRRLLEKEHAMPMGHGLVGRAASGRAPILVTDVSQDPRWVPNALLPETRAELAVPIAIGNEFLGVIDVQDNEVDGLKAEDRELLQSIADQTAVALRNAEFVRQAQRRAGREATINQIRQKILQTRDVESALKTAARELAVVTRGRVGVRLNQTAAGGTNGRAATGSGEEADHAES